MYDKGLGNVGVDKEEAFKWCEYSAAKGNKDAQYLLGTKHERGNAAGVNRQKAATLYRLAASQGHQQAQNALDKLLAHERQLVEVRKKLNSSLEIQRAELLTKKQNDKENRELLEKYTNFINYVESLRSRKEALKNRYEKFEGEERNFHRRGQEFEPLHKKFIEQVVAFEKRSKINKEGVDRYNLCRNNGHDHRDVVAGCRYQLTEEISRLQRIESQIKTDYEKIIHPMEEALVREKASILSQRQQIMDQALQIQKDEQALIEIEKTWNEKPLYLRQSLSDACAGEIQHLESQMIYLQNEIRQIDRQRIS